MSGVTAVSTIHENERIGIVVGETTSTSFVFSSTKDLCPSKLDYLIVKSEAMIDEKITETDVLAQVEAVMSSSDALKHLVSFEALTKIQEANIGDLRTYGSAQVLGYIHPITSDVLIPRRSITPGTEVYSAPRDFLEKFYSYPRDESLTVGNLITRPRVSVGLTVSGLRRHMAIIAQTGAGKSYCAGVLIEELLEKGGSIIVVDPHADYALMGMSVDKSRHELSDRLVVFRNPASTGRYSEKDVGNMEDYTIAFSDLSDEEIFRIANIQEGYKVIRETVSTALQELRDSDTIFSPQDLVSKLEENLQSADKQSEKSPIQSALRYVRILSRMRVFSSTSTPTERILSPMQVSIMDLSGLNAFSTDYIVSKLLSDTYHALLNGEYAHPVFVVIEEAHNFIPANDTTRSSPIIKRIAAEGRKFGIFLIVISQRPSKIHPDTLSQCNSQIIMKLTNPKDQEAVIRSSERMSEGMLKNLPGFNPGEAVVLGPVSKAPVMIKIRKRKTHEGGADIDVVEALKSARREVSIDREIDETTSNSSAFTGAFGDEVE